MSQEFNPVIIPVPANINENDMDEAYNNFWNNSIKHSLEKGSFKDHPEVEELAKAILENK